MLNIYIYSTCIKDVGVGLLKVSLLQALQSVIPLLWVAHLLHLLVRTPQTTIHLVVMVLIGLLTSYLLLRGVAYHILEVPTLAADLPVQTHIPCDLVVDTEALIDAAHYRVGYLIMGVGFQSRRITCHQCRSLLLYETIPILLRALDQHVLVDITRDHHQPLIHNLLVLRDCA